MYMYRGSAYCQDVNKQKRLAWAQQHVGDTFEDIIWTDEASTQMEATALFAAESVVRPTDPNQGQCSVHVHVELHTASQCVHACSMMLVNFCTPKHPIKSTYGRVSAREAEQGSVCLRELWTSTCLLASSRRPFCHSSKNLIQMDTN